MDHKSIWVEQRDSPSSGPVLDEDWWRRVRERRPKQRKKEAGEGPPYLAPLAFPDGYERTRDHIKGRDHHSPEGGPSRAVI